MTINGHRPSNPTRKSSEPPPQAMAATLLSPRRRVSLLSLLSTSILLLLSVLPSISAKSSIMDAAPAPASLPAPPPLPPAEACVGVYLKYSHNYREKIRPYLPYDPADQPYAFESTATVLNADTVPVEAWSLHVGFPNNTILVSASSAVISGGFPFPFQVGSNDTTGATFVGFPTTGLKTAIETAGNLKEIQAIIDIKGTEFGTIPPDSPPPLPTTLLLDNPEFLCEPLEVIGKRPNYIHTCCERDPKFKPNSSISGEFLERRVGDLSIDYDVLQTYDSNYLARVTIENHNSLGRLDHWELNWEWMQGEFIYKMQGAVTTRSDPSDCLFGPPEKYYENMDFSTVMNCERRPTIVDLPPSMKDDEQMGRIPFCCRNGTILPEEIDPEKSVSAFQLQVNKMPPYEERTDLSPPQNWAIRGGKDTLNPSYNCSPPIRVSPSAFHTPLLPTKSFPIATWQVVCNVTKKKTKPPRCCVSFSAFHNESAVPCETCACGCPAGAGRNCSARSKAMLIPPDGLLRPYVNRTEEAVEWASIKHFPIPSPLPCGDNCGVTINWHVNDDYRGGWSARMTMFNWGERDIPDWFAAVVLPKAYDGFEEAYSFNGSAVGNDTLFLKGLPGLNYLVKVSPGPEGLNPGKLQSVMSFVKNTTRKIDVVGRDGYPKKVFFNGEECSLPDRIPLARGGHLVVGRLSNFAIAAVAILLFM